MSIVIRKTNNSELQQRHDELTSDLQARFTDRDFHDLAKLGLLNSADMELYSELRRIEFLLDD
ncbi:hypothetical protein [uncultured Corynebacterium sp.]|uniref:hypothetical protein n=1 Tax=uncultured Corynebacterium sp. TaxID=159447 RepID=UPI0025DB2C19|nr:hypothetical protein [uncultured Corynebacterium sp.]